MKSILAFAFLAIAMAPALAQQCSIEYQRADNSFAAPGRPDGQLGKETLTLNAGETKVFNTDWKYEKRRNDGQNYYGSHMRIVRNTGQHPVMLTFRGNLSDMMKGGIPTKVVGERGTGELKPGQSASNLRADLMEVSCAAAGKDSRSSGPTPGGTPAGSAPGIQPPTNLMARQITPNDIQLTWQPVPNAKEYRVYVSPPPQPYLAGKPTIVGGTGGSFIIPIPRTNPPPGYSAAIEAVGNDGSVSPRVAFNSVPVQPMGGPSGGGPVTGTGPGPTTSPATPASSGIAGQQCPSGQFVTGFSSTGALICASPR